MAISLESDRYALPPLQYDSGDVLIKLGHEQSDWLVVHSKNMSESSPMLRAALSSRWAKTIGIDKIEHPRTGEDVGVKTMALKYVDGAYFLEGKKVLLDLRLDAEVFQDTQWCEGKGWPQMGRDMLGYRSVLDMTTRAFKVLTATMHGIHLTAEQVAGRPDRDNPESRLEDFGASRWINEILFPQAVTVCAIAEFLDCLTTVGPAMMAILHSAPRYWQAVAYKPLQHMILAVKFKNREVYHDAYQHALAQAYHNDGVDWQSISAIAGSNWKNDRDYCSTQFSKMEASAANLKDDLHRLQAGVGRVQQGRRPRNNVWSIFGIVIAGPGYDAEADAKECYNLIARSMFGNWLAQHLHVQLPRLADARFRSEEPVVRPLGPNDVPALRLNLAVYRLEQAALSNDPTSIFGLQTPRRFASRFSMYAREKEEEGIREALIDVVKKANIAIERFRNLDLTLDTVTHAEYDYARGIVFGSMKHRIFPRPNVLHITGGCHFDGHDAGYFTCLKVPYAVPFSTWSGETKVLKCEPLDSETLLESQQWMDRVFEPCDEKRRPFVLDFGSIIDLLKFLGTLVFLYYVFTFLRSA